MTPADAALLREGAARFGVDLDTQASQRIATFVAILDSWNRRLRLTGEQDPRTLADKHTLDSLAVAAFLPVAGPVVDIGSGAGFPGIVLSCVRPDLDMVLVDSRRRPVSFLREVIRQVPLPRTRALERRGEDLTTAEALGGRASLVVSRALRLDAFLPLASPLLAPEGVVVAMQTPRIAHEEAMRHGEAHRLSLTGMHDYSLPGGEQRRLLLFARTW